MAAALYVVAAVSAPVWMVNQFEFCLHFYELFIVLFWSQNTSVSIHFVTSISCKRTNISLQAVDKLYIGSYICFQTLNTIDLSCYCYHGQVYSDDHEAKPLNKSLVDQNSQVIFLNKMLDPDFWKILTQGGLTAHNVKYKKTTSTVIRCPMFIKCQENMNFGKEHNSARDIRLRKFQFKSFKSLSVPDVQQFLKDHVMDCFVWASHVAKTSQWWTTPSSSRTHFTRGSLGWNREAKNTNLGYGRE